MSCFRVFTIASDQEFTRAFGVSEDKIKLIFPTKFKPCLRQSTLSEIVPPDTPFLPNLQHVRQFYMQSPPSLTSSLSGKPKCSFGVT